MPAKTNPSDRVWDVLSKLMVAVTIAMGGAVITHEIRLGSIESRQFTLQDANEMERRLLEHLPPSWLREDIKELKGGQKEILRRVTTLETNHVK